MTRIGKRRPATLLGAAVLLFGVTSGCAARAQVPAHPASAAAERDTTSLLSPRRIAALPAAEREAWTRYLETSRRLKAADQAAMAAELKAAGLERMTPAPNVRASFSMRPYMTDEWFRSDTARRLAESILSYQTPSGGWSKHMDLAAGPRRPGTSYYSESANWSYIGTIDNSSTTDELRFLARAHAAHGDARYRDAFLRGLAYLHHAQYPNGCWPQVYPLQGGYHDAATFNDDATVNVLKLFRDVGRGERAGFGFVPAAERERAAAALARGVDCIVASQVVVDGRRTAWGQQHDPLTLAPVGARSYELPSLSGRESAGIVELLMGLPRPDARVVQAVHAAVDWFRQTAIHGYDYDFQAGRTARAGAGPIWARMAEIGTNRPIFSNRDGVKLYDYEQLTDRSRGYAWYGTEPAAVLKKYETWARKHPRQ